MFLRKRPFNRRAFANNLIFERERELEQFVRNKLGPPAEMRCISVCVITIISVVIVGAMIYCLIAWIGLRRLFAVAGRLLIGQFV